MPEDSEVEGMGGESQIQDSEFLKWLSASV